MPAEYILFGFLGLGLIALIFATQRSRKRDRESGQGSGDAALMSSAISTTLSGNPVTAAIAVAAAAKDGEKNDH